MFKSGTVSSVFDTALIDYLTNLTSVDPARVINMPPVIYVPRKLPGIIRCPVDANPPVTSVKWEKDGYPLRVEKVSFLCPRDQIETEIHYEIHFLCRCIKSKTDD